MASPSSATALWQRANAERASVVAVAPSELCSGGSRSRRRCRRLLPRPPRPPERRRRPSFPSPLLLGHHELRFHSLGSQITLPAGHEREDAGDDNEREGGGITMKPTRRKNLSKRLNSGGKTAKDPSSQSSWKGILTNFPPFSTHFSLDRGLRRGR